MKASELVNFLNDMISNYGDLELTTEIDDIFEKDKANFGHVESVFFDMGRIVISGQEVSVSNWCDQYNSNCSVMKSDHYTVFRNIEAPKESTGYANYDSREF